VAAAAPRHQDLTVQERERAIHLAFAARSRAEVRAFHEAALAAGARDNGAPGLRPECHPGYYGTFVIDPDGHTMEAVCHAAERQGFIGAARPGFVRAAPA
jgi:predicted lactoylglutathione lyase